MTAAALDGIRVVDFSTGPAGGLATTVLADFGAQVIKVEPLGGDRFRPLSSSPFWLRGKQSVALDLSTNNGRSRAEELTAGADIVVVSGSAAQLRARRLDASGLHATNPALIHCAISGWGANGPYAEWPAYEGLVAAKAGRMASFDVQLDKDRPVFAGVQVATHIASQAAVQGMLAALYRRTLTGRGEVVETSLLQALMPLDLVDTLAIQVAERLGDPFVPVRKLSPMPTLNYHPVRASDGVWIQCGNLLEHLFYSFLDALDLLGEFMVDERFQGSPAIWDRDAVEEARDRILTRVQERTASEWMETFAENGNVAAEPIVPADEAIRHRDLVEGGCLVEVDDPDRGLTTQIGPIAELSATPAVVGRTATAITDDRDPGWKVRAANPTPINESPNPPGRPLDGVTIIDLSTIIAGPLAISMLADLGARVIKVEPLTGDPYRFLLTHGRMAVKTNLGKESVCIDLKTARGQSIVHELAATADVVVHNFRGSVPGRLGIDFDTLRALNPNLISAVINGYGPHGPSAHRPATHPVMGAAAGGVAYQAGAALTRECPTLDDVRECARQIMAANDSSPDPNTSVVVASAILLALLARQRHGIAQQVHVNMQVANAWANHDAFIAYEGKAPRPAIDDAHRGLNAGYRLYETRDGWIFLAVTSDAEFASFCEHAGCKELASDGRYSTASARATNDAQLVAHLAEVFMRRSATEWEADLSSHGVGCVQADGPSLGRFLVEDPHVLANGWAPTINHTRFGQVRRWGPVVMVGGLNPDYGTAALAGEQTDALLGELGRSESEIAELRADKIVNSGSL